jgi:hypothetical protein
MTTAGQRRELARYELPAGTRILYGQRIAGRVAITDVPAGDTGRVFLVERHIESQAALTGLVADYVSEARRRGEPAAIVPHELAES